MARIGPYVLGLVAIPISLQGILTDISAVGLNWFWVMLRLAIIPVGLCGVLAYRIRKVRLDAATLPIVVVISYLTAECLFFISRTGMANSFYYHSIIQMLFGITMLPFSPRGFALAFGIPAIGFIALILSHNGFDFGVFTHGSLLYFKTYAIITLAIYIVTHRVRTELYRTHIRLEDEIVTREAVISKQVEQLSEANTAKAIAQTTQMLAHDVRKPFSMLRMGLSMLGNAKDPESVKKVMSRIVPEIDKAMISVDGMIADVMEVGSVSTNLIQEPACPESLIESTLGEIIRIYPEANITFTYDLKHTHMANVHVQKIGRVFSNIIGNSFQAMRNKGLMWFKTSERDGMIEFCLGNAGSVIPAESLPKLFEAFFTSDKKGGTGLGLAIAQKIVTAHGGKIWCESSKTAAHPDGKVEFFFTLPVASRTNRTTATLPHHSYDIAKQLDLAANAPESLSIDKGELSLEEDVVQNYIATKLALRVLIIDDEAIYRSALASYLMRTPELSSALDIIQVNGSTVALQALSERDFDLIITDVDMGMTSLDGFELVRELRKRGSKALICVHSNRICAGDNKAAIEAGADSFMPKPMARAQLLRIVLQAAAVAKISATESVLVDTATIDSKPSVLIIDDDAFVIYAWEEMLAKDTTLYTMQSFEELQERLATEPDFLQRLSYVVTDMHLDGSDGDGLDVGRLIKSIRPNLPILMSSNGIFEDHELVGAVDKVIAKEPVGISELHEWCAKLVTSP
jgi:signal transduction histidine kinase/CheY-like chemotaxis protein